jgi:peptide/nickel transport system substrate-binding protein
VSTRSARPVVVISALLLVLASACAPAAEGPKGTTAPASALAPAAAVKKILTIADGYEPTSVIGTFAVGHQQTGGNNVRRIVHDDLVAQPQFQQYQPRLATELPSIEKGTWRVDPSGRMDVTWRLRPNIKWHDGQPFTSADLLFSFQANRDTELTGLSVSATDRLIDSAEAPDDLTFIVHWNSPYVNAAITTVGDPVPRHLMESTYLTNKLQLQTTPLTTTEFVGLGAYKMVRWEQGSILEVVRFDDYYLGRPPLDSIVVRFVRDSNTLIANILAGAADAVVSAGITGGVSVEQALEVRRQWAGTGNQVVTIRSGLAYWGEPQLRPEYERPAGTMSNPAIRKALLQAIDIPALVEVMTGGLSPVADSYFMPDEPRRAEMESSIAKFPYDRARAIQLLADAGWQRGADGGLTRSSDGQRFDIEFWARAGSNEKVASIVANDWKQLGISATPFVIPAALATDREYEGKRPGYLCCPTVGVANFYAGKLHTRQITSEATRWQGINYGGYSNPKADALVDQLNNTLDPRDRLPLERDLMQEYSSNVALTPLWWAVYPQLVLAGVKGPQPTWVDPTTNIFQWDKE